MNIGPIIGYSYINTFKSADAKLEAAATRDANEIQEASSSPSSGASGNIEALLLCGLGIAGALVTKGASLLACAPILSGCNNRAVGYDPDAQVDEDAMPLDVQVVDAQMPDASIEICDPGPHSHYLQVPASYPTIQEAINQAQKGDVVQLAVGTYEIDGPIYMKECTHIYGSGRDVTVLKRNSIAYGIQMTNGCSIHGLEIQGYLDSQGMSVHVLANKASITDCTFRGFGDIGVYVVGQGEDSIIHIENNIFVGEDIAPVLNSFNGILIYGNTFGEIKGNIFENYLAGIGLAGSSVRIRNNEFRSDWYNSVAIGISYHPDFENANPNLGEINDPGNNIFDAAGYYVTVGEDFNMDINCRGNYFDSATREEMTLHPDPYAADADITKLLDRHDTASPTASDFSTIDYRDFKTIN